MSTIDYTNTGVQRRLYKLDSNGRLRFWQMERQGSKYRTISGLADGNPVISGWTQATAARMPSDETQAIFEVEAKYKHQLDREYHETVDTVATPNFFEPMLAKKFEKWTGEVCFSQPKLDGIRCIAKADGLWSRQGQPITAVPHIMEALESLFVENPDLVLDGELYNHHFREDFGEISSIVRKKKPTDEDLEKARRLMQYHIYDLPSHPNEFSYRNAALAQIIDPAHGILWLVPTDQVRDAEHLDALYGQYLEEGYEGQMVRLDEPYEQKRSKTLLKRKEFQDAEFECVSIEEGNGNWAGLAKRVTCRLPDGRTFGAGIKGNASRAAELLNEKHDVVTVQYFHLSPDGVPRFPVVTKFHGETRTL